MREGAIYSVMSLQYLNLEHKPHYRIHRAIAAPLHKSAAICIICIPDDIPLSATPCNFQSNRIDCATWPPDT